MLGWVAFPARAADPAWQDEMKWLETMAFAAHQVNYSGTFVYRYDDHVETSRTTHVVDGNGEHGRLESLDGVRREVIRHNDKVWCYVGDRKVRVEQRQAGREFPALLPEQQLALLKENYQLKQADEARVAGFPVHVLILQPKDSLRYTHKMFAQKDSGLLLKTEVLDEHGAVVEQYAFTQLDIGGNIDRSWIKTRPSRQSASAVHPVHHEPQQGDLPHIASHVPVGVEVLPVNSGWRVDALPPGFKKVTEVRRHISGKDGQVIQMVFSDGLAGISLFIEKSDNDEDDHAGLFSQGIIQVYSKPVGDQLVTVVGEVPPQTVIQIADSVRFAGE